VQNLTDVDDRIIRRAGELRIDAPELARMYERAYRDDMRPLRNDCVDVYARASDDVDQVISQIERLQQAAAAYATADGIYFDLTAFPGYGRLSGLRTSCAAIWSRGWRPIPRSATRATTSSGSAQAR
jgi:cysteinyl-tRNA synthetase